MAIFLSS